MSKKVTRAELVDEFNRLAQELGKRPTLTEYNEHGKYSSTPVYKRFESFEELKEEAGFETGQQKHTDEELLADLRRVAEKIGRSPPILKYDEHGNHNSKTLKSRFGNWSEVLSEAGLEDTGHAKHWSDNEPKQFEKDYGSVEIICEHCGGTDTRTPFEVERYDRFFCDKECKGAFMSNQTGEEARSWEGGKVTIHCEVCGNPRKVRPSKVDKSRFCSEDCMLDWRSRVFSGEDHPRWKGGYQRYYGPNWYKQRQKALARDGYECQSCGKSREEHHAIWDCDPVVHHIVPFRECEGYKEANQLENLLTLCKECHGLIESGNKELPESATGRI